MPAYFLNGALYQNSERVEVPVLYVDNLPAMVPPYTIKTASGNRTYVNEQIYYSGGFTPSIYSSGSGRMWIKKNGVMQEPFATICANHDGNFHTVLQFANNSRIEFKATSETASSFRGILSNSEPVNTRSLNLTNPSNVCFSVLTDGEGTYYTQLVYTSVAECGILNIGYNNDIVTSQDLAPTYTWRAWDQIAGNGGQFRLNLTKIKDASLEDDFSQYVQGDESDFSRLSAKSSIWNIFHNTPYGSPVRIAYSGNGYMTMELTDVTGSELQTVTKFTFRFYRRELGPGVAFYTQEYTLTTGGDISGRYVDLFLSFVYDQTQQVALFLPVMKNAAGYYFWGQFNTIQSENAMGDLFMWLASSGSPEADSPYSTGTTDDGGNPGGPMPQSHIDVPATPSLGGLGCDMVTLYAPTSSQMSKISKFLWSSDFIENVAKFFNNVSENIIAFYALPYKPLNNPTKVLTVGNYQSDDTDLQSVEYIEDRFYTIDMGDVRVKPFWGSYLDYAPYSKLSVYLPGIGIQNLDPDDIFCPALEDGQLSTPDPEGTTLHLDYMIDMLTGSLVAFISINGEMRYQFAGKIGYSIPITGANYTRMIQGAVTAIAGMIGAGVTGGAAAPFAASATAAGIINAMKPDVVRGSNLSGDTSMMTRKTPFLIYSRPNKPLLNDQDKFTGFPSYKIDTLSNFSGYTEVIDCHVEGFSCTDEERERILAALKGGVII